MIVNFSDLQRVDVFLHHLEIAEEDHVDDARADDGYPEATIGSGVEEADIGPSAFAGARTEKRFLVKRFSDIDRVDLYEKNIVSLTSQRSERTPTRLTQAQLTIPQSPPATTTAYGLVALLPRAFPIICFVLSYVIK
jgi:hypothetical protein